MLRSFPIVRFQTSPRIPGGRPNHHRSLTLLLLFLSHTHTTHTTHTQHRQHDKGECTYTARLLSHVLPVGQHLLPNQQRVGHHLVSLSPLFLFLYCLFCLLELYWITHTSNIWLKSNNNVNTGVRGHLFCEHQPPSLRRVSGVFSLRQPI